MVQAAAVGASLGPWRCALAGCRLFQALQHLPPSSAFSASSQAAQQADTNQQQQQDSSPSTSTPGLLAFDEVYVSANNLRASTAPPSTAAMQEHNPITAVFLHGLLGCGRNWRSFSRKLAVEAAAKANRDVRVLLLDVRCHGDSAALFGFHPPHDMSAAARDVTSIIQHELQGQAPHLLVGLSLGGKIALETLKQMVEAQEAEQHRRQHLYERAPPILPPSDVVAAAAPSSSSSGEADSSSQPHLRGLPQQVWVLDSQPGTVPIDVDAPTSVGKIIQLIHSIPTPLSNRQELYRLLEAKGIPLAVAQWLGTSLAPGGRWAATANNSSSNGSNGDQKLDWVFDIQGAAALYNSYRLSSYWEVLTRPPPGTVVHLVRGERSDRWTPHMLQQLQEAQDSWQEHAAEAPEGVGQLQMHCLEGAGHWLQSDNPEGLHAMMLPWMRDIHENHLQW